MTEIVLKPGEGYNARQVPTVPVDLHGTVYRARRPKNTTPILIAEVQQKFAGLGELGDSAEAMRDSLAEVRHSVWLLVRAMFSQEETEQIVARMVDPAEDVDLEEVFRVYTAVQQHFAEETEGEFADMGLEPPEPAQKAAKKASSRKPAARKANGAKGGASKR